MTINTRLRIAAWAPLVLALIVGTALGVAHLAISTSQQRGQVVERVIRSMNDLHNLVGVYSLYHAERPRQQFLAEHDNIMHVLASAHFPDPVQQQSLDTIRDNMATIKDTFAQVVALHERLSASPDAAALHRHADRLAGQLLVRSRQAEADGLHLETLVNNEIAATQRTVNILVVLLMLTVTVPLTLILVRMTGSIRGHLATLHQGTAMVGSGNLAYRIDMAGDDELAALARAFDQMTGRLQAVTVSKNALEREVEERVRAEQALRRSAQFPEENPNPVLRVAVDGALLYANAPARKWLATLGWQDDSPLPAPVRAVVAEASGQDLAFQTEISNRAGRTFWLSAVQPPGEDYINLYGRDITERQQTEARLREHEEWLRVTLESIGDAVIASDTAGRVTFLNPVAASLTGWSADAALGQPVSDVFCIVNELTHEPADNLVARVLRENCIVELANHTALVTKDGREVPVEDSAAPITDADGRVAGVVIVFHDVTAKRRAEEALQEADRAKDEFLSILSHELQTPITSMLGWAQLAIKQATPELMSRALEIVQRNARRQKGMVDELLDVSRLLNRKIELQVETLDLGTLARQATEDLQVEANERGVTLACASGDDPLLVRVDPARLQQCLGNLLQNGLKFTPEGGEITVDSVLEDGQAIVRVRDTGRGIPPEALPSIFALFRQVDRDERAGGLGLGLAITRGLVELHGGAITADSPGLNQGSTFTISLPLVEEGLRGDR
ncbi:MAG: ATP-binding protein [Armatimonadota bacterium]